VRQRFDELERGGGFKALAELKAAGEVRAIGAGINHTGMIPRFLDRFPMDYFLVAMPYTLLDQEALDVEFPLCAERGVGIVIGAVFASGVLATGVRKGALYRYLPLEAEVADRVKRMQAVCARHDVPLAAAALQFPLAHPIVAAVIPGADAPEQVRQNAGLMQQPIPAELWADLKCEGLLRQDAPVPGE
jgi:D-threo-aldose 1-dehydrogenase